MTTYLNPEHPAAAYQCGRLLAVLAKLQREALGEVGANVVRRFYTGFSQAPGLILGRLVANAQNHLGSIDSENDRLGFEASIKEIMGRLKDDAPRILNLEEQGLFALGYYQQLAVPSAKNAKT